MHNHRHIHMRGGERYPPTNYSTRNVGPTNSFSPYSYRPLHSQLSLYQIYKYIYTHTVFPTCKGLKGIMFKEDFTLSAAIERSLSFMCSSHSPHRSALRVWRWRTWREKTKMGFCFSLEAKILFVLKRKIPFGLLSSDFPLL